MDNVKICTTCGEVKKIDMFSKNKNEKLGVGHECKSCYSKRKKKYRAKNKAKLRKYAVNLKRQSPEKVLAYGRKSHYKIKFGISYQDVIDMWESQKKLCLICEIEMQLGGHSPNSANVDHCHKTKIIRGLICNSCNLALGLFKDNKKSLLSAAKYLERTQNA